MKSYNKLKELIEGELCNYSYFEGWDIEIEDSYKEWDYFILHTRCNSVRFRVSGDEIEIELGEDSYYEIRGYDTSIKYLWMALLKWE